MSTGTSYYPADEILNKTWNPAGTAPAANPDSNNVYLAGIAGSLGLIGSGSAQSGTGNGAFHVVQNQFRIIQVDNVTTASSDGTGVITTGLGAFRTIDVYVKCTQVDGTASTVDFTVDSRLDGTNWVNIGHFGQLTSATGGTAQAVMHLIRGGTGNVTMTVDVNAGAGTVRQFGWGDDLRIVRTLSGGTTAPIVSYKTALVAS